MIDRIVHHAEVITLKGSNYRLKNTNTTLPSEKQKNKAQQPQQPWSTFHCRKRSTFR
jgi:hypothetical protein